MKCTSGFRHHVATSTFGVNGVSGAPNIHRRITYLEVKITYLAGFAQGGSEHWNIQH